MKTIALLCVVSPVAVLGSFDKYEEAEIQEIVQGKLYAGKGTDSSGQMIYFGLEFVDESNIEGWSAFSGKQDTLIQFLCRDTQKLLPKKRKVIFDVKGLSVEDTESFQNMYREKCKRGNMPANFTHLEKGAKEALKDFSFTMTERAFVGYVLDEPVTGYFKHPKGETETDIHKGYQSLLMAVRSIESLKAPVFNNQSCLGNLAKMPFFDYADLSLKLHGFTADVFSSVFNKTHMGISLLPGMYRRFERLFEGEEDQFYDGEDIPKELKFFRGGFGWDYIPCVISAKALVAPSAFKSLIWANEELWRSQGEKPVTDIG